MALIAKAGAKVGVGDLGSWSGGDGVAAPQRISRATATSHRRDSLVAVMGGFVADAVTTVAGSFKPTGWSASVAQTVYTGGGGSLAPKAFRPSLTPCTCLPPFLLGPVYRFTHF